MTDNDLIEAAEPGLPSLVSLADMAEHYRSGRQAGLVMQRYCSEIEIRVTASDIPQQLQLFGMIGALDLLN